MSKNFNLEVTYDFAVKKLSSMDPNMISNRSGCPFNANDKIFTVEFLNSIYQISFPDGIVSRPDEEEVSLAMQVLLLHYLIHAQGTPPSGQYITYKEIPDGSIYIAPFTKRAINPLVQIFGHNPDKLLQAAEKAGGRKAEVGDVSVTIPVFPRISLTYVIWLGDDEFPPSGNVLFDASAPDYLPAEDYAVMAQTVVWHLKKLAG